MNIQNLLELVKKQEFPIKFYGNWVNKERHIPTESVDYSKSFNPNNGQLIITTGINREILHKTVDSASTGLKILSKYTIEERLELISKMSKLLADYREDLIKILSIETATPIWEASDDFDTAMSYFDLIQKNHEHVYAALTSPIGITHRNAAKCSLKPLGITCALLPFSETMSSFAVYFISAMFSGSPLILIPSDHASLSGLMFSHLDKIAGLPAGALNVVFGGFSSFRQLLSDKRITSVIYTGSKEHCDKIIKEGSSATGRRLVLQSGGKNSVLVHPSADIDTAVKCTVYGAFKSAGQLCTSTSRVFVHSSLLNSFQEKLIETTQQLKIGVTDSDQTTDQPFMGALYSDRGVDKFLKYQTMALRETKKVWLRGEALDKTLPSGFFVSPNINLLEKFDNSSAYQSNVLFCPNLAVYEYNSTDEAIEMANTSNAPFTISLVGNNDELRDLTDSLSMPNIFINRPTTSVDTPSLIGSKLLGGHRYLNGLGLALFLSYPHIIHNEHSCKNIFNNERGI